MMRLERLEEVAEAGAEAVGDRRVPPDRPGAEGGLSRAESRSAVLAANKENLGHRPYAERLDTPIADGEPTPRQVLARFVASDAGLGAVNADEAAAYIGENADRRPWLAPAKDSVPVVQQVLAAMDQGRGHALERHEGYADDARLQRRVTMLEDPAQLDDAKRARGIDGCRPGDRAHRCGSVATAIQDPEAFATAFVRGVEHPAVRAALTRPFDAANNPPRVEIPLDELLGADSGRYCGGFRLVPVDGGLRESVRLRDAWATTRARGEDPGPEPRSEPIDSFDGGIVQFRFRANQNQNGYEISTMYVEPGRRSDAA